MASQPRIDLSHIDQNLLHGAEDLHQRIANETRQSSLRVVLENLGLTHSGKIETTWFTVPFRLYLRRAKRPKLKPIQSWLAPFTSLFTTVLEPSLEFCQKTVARLDASHTERDEFEIGARHVIKNAGS